jgi:uncharacterized protein
VPNLFYLDASALGKRFAPEAGSSLVHEVFAKVQPDRITVLSIGLLEVASILVRKRNSGSITPANYSAAVAQFNSELMKSTAIVRVTAHDVLVLRSLPFIERHSLNATDAIVLQSAVDLAASERATGNDLILVSSDRRLIYAAQAEGLVTFDPETQTTAELNALICP